MRPHGTPQELEARRLRAADLLRDGMKPAHVARMVGCSPSSVHRWEEAIGKKGVEGLKAIPHPGRTPKLSQRQKVKLVKILLRGPVAAGYRTDLWTCPRVGEVIQRTFGVEYNVGHVWHAREQNEHDVQRWRQHNWRHIKKGSKARQ